MAQNIKTQTEQRRADILNAISARKALESHLANKRGRIVASFGGTYCEINGCDYLLEQAGYIMIDSFTSGMDAGSLITVWENEQYLDAEYGRACRTHWDTCYYLSANGHGDIVEINTPMLLRAFWDMCFS